MNLKKCLKEIKDQARWQQELKKYRQWETDLNQAQDFTEQEQEAYQKMMEKL